MRVLECFDMNMEAGSSSTSSVTVYRSILHHMAENLNTFRNSKHKLHEKRRIRVFYYFYYHYDYYYYYYYYYYY